MNELIGRVFSFEAETFPRQRDLFARLVRDGQSPKALIISCADSRVMPEQVLRANPGDLFVCRNAGNIVPPYSLVADGMIATVEYAIKALGIRDIIVCGHSDCGAMKALADPAKLAGVPAVASWLDHAVSAGAVAREAYPDLEGDELLRAVTLENVVAQLANLRTHPAVASAIARGELALHGWMVDIHHGQVLGLDGETGQFVPLRDGETLPVALPAAPRTAAADYAFAMAAE